MIEIGAGITIGAGVTIGDEPVPFTVTFLITEDDLNFIDNNDFFFIEE
jgi:hypothetical protein